jgi:hypothetical protein
MRMITIGLTTILATPDFGRAPRNTGEQGARHAITDRWN